MSSDRGHEQDVLLGMPWKIELPVKAELSPCVSGFDRVNAALTHLESARANHRFDGGCFSCAGAGEFATERVGPTENRAIKLNLKNHKLAASLDL